MTEIIPTIIPESLEHIREQALSVRDYVKVVQIDIMDGKYSPNPSWPFTESEHLPADVPNLSQELRLGFELDMLVLEPEKYIDEWILFGISTFIIHVETTDDLEKVVTQVLSHDKDVALALKPSTSIKALAPFIDRVSFVQVMGNDKVGFNSVALSDKALECIRNLRNQYKDLIIGVDIGVNFETAPKIVKAGANRLASGSAIHKAEDKSAAIQKLSLF